MNERAFLERILHDPGSARTTFLVLADWLEEHGDPRHELIRLQHDPRFRTDLSDAERDQRIRTLLLGRSAFRNNGGDTGREYAHGIRVVVDWRGRN
jgi:uncharacterized protein (TIGR02996 family)